MRASLSRTFALAFLALVIAATATVGFSAVASAATQATNTFENIRVRGTTEADGKFRGRLDIRNFREGVGNELRAIGRLSGRILDSDGDLVGRISDKRVSLPLTLEGAAPAGANVPQATCEILELHLGPLDLDLLGLQVHLNEIVLTINAEPGPGNLLGNLLCAIAGLLDRGGLNDVLVSLLRVLRQLVNIFG